MVAVSIKYDDVIEACLHLQKCVFFIYIQSRLVRKRTVMQTFRWFEIFQLLILMG